ncbi:MAG: TMEM175 family protein [Candidatus Paceibacterota bacterium]
MNKARLEALSDGVFSIVLTILVFDIRLPEHTGAISNAELWNQLLILLPSITSFALSFLVIAVFWINHNFLFHTYTKKIDRGLNLLNLVYLLFLVFVPFSAHLMGTYSRNEPAALIYGLNILIIIVLMRIMFAHVSKRPELLNDVSTRISKQARFRATLTIVSYILGIVCSFVYIPASIFFYVIPMLFNVIPGTLDLIERIFRFKLA